MVRASEVRSKPWVAVLYEAAPSVRAEPDKESPLGKLLADKGALAGSTSTCNLVKFLSISLVWLRVGRESGGLGHWSCSFALWPCSYSWLLGIALLVVELTMMNLYTLRSLPCCIDSVTPL